MHSHETHERSFVKTILWRVIATLITWATIYFFTGQIGESTEIALTGAIAGMIAYYIYERAWDGIEWGRIEQK